MLADVPLLVAGSTMLNPFGPRASAVIEGVDEVATACHAIASANPLPAQA